MHKDNESYFYFQGYNDHRQEGPYTDRVRYLIRYIAVLNPLTQKLINKKLLTTDMYCKVQ